MASKKDYYDILGVRRGASEEEIEKAYQKLARTYQFVPQPGNRTADFRFREILEAYEILSDKSRRERYDRMGLDLFSQEDMWDEGLDEAGEEENSLDGFEDLLGPGSEGGEPGAGLAPQKGREIRLTLEIGLECAVRGAKKEVQVLQEISCPPCEGRGVDAQGPQKLCGQCGGAGQIQVGLLPAAVAKECDRCQGRGKVFVRSCEACSGKGWVRRKKSIRIQIPPGVSDHCRLVLTHKGHTGKNGGQKGDLVAEIRVAKHPYFERKGDDLHLEVLLAVWEAALGAEIEVPTLDGGLRVKIPAGVQPGDHIRIAGRGVPFLHGGGRGDQILVLRIQIPRKMDEKSKKIMEGLRKHSQADPRRHGPWPGRSKEGDSRGSSPDHIHD
jgi:molecular chaperone DnaJ